MSMGELAKYMVEGERRAESAQLRALPCGLFTAETVPLKAQVNIFNGTFSAIKSKCLSRCRIDALFSIPSRAI